MDERGFIFTSDATLALIVIFIVSASITAYIMAPYFMGQEHQHLQALASDTLETMERDGTLTLAAVRYSQNNVIEGNQILSSRLNVLIPSDTAYNLTMLGNAVDRNTNSLFANDTATAVRVISGPEEGYLGRAWYKQEEVEMEDKEINVISTLWNFHNYLSNFQPWKNNGLYNRQYWGSSGSNRPGSPVPIEFSIPEGVTLHNAFFLQGTNNESANNLNRLSFGTQLTINGHNYGNTTPFTMLYPRVNANGQMTNGLIYNYKGDIDINHLKTGDNNEFYVWFNYQNMLRSNYNYNMPWFSLIANYTTTIQVPKGILNLTEEDQKFPDAAGLAKTNNNAGGYYGKIYNLETGEVTNFTERRVLSWYSFRNNRNLLDNYDDGTPFVFEDVSGSEDGSAVSVVKEFTIPNNARIFDGYVNINAYGAVDKALVEVWDGTQWRAVFCSFDFSEIPGAPNTDYTAGDGYGNTPGIIYIGEHLHPGNNKVRITVWDDVPSNDYDLVGIVDSKVYVSYSTLPIKWNTFTFNSYQAGSGQTYQFPERTFSIGPDATRVYMFVGVGTTTQHIKVEVRNSTGNSWATLYDDDTVPFMIDLAELDAAGPHRFTTGNVNNYNLTEGTGYRVRVTVTAPLAWKSGDGASSPGTYGNPTIFSGTRIAVIYKYLENKWTTHYSNNAQTAKDLAKEQLIDELEQSGINVDPDLVQTEALFTGNLPNAIPVRLDLWK